MDGFWAEVECRAFGSLIKISRQPIETLTLDIHHGVKPPAYDNEWSRMKSHDFVSVYSIYVCVCVGDFTFFLSIMKNRCSDGTDFISLFMFPPPSRSVFFFHYLLGIKCDLCSELDLLCVSGPTSKHAQNLCLSVTKIDAFSSNYTTSLDSSFQLDEWFWS